MCLPTACTDCFPAPDIYPTETCRCNCSSRRRREGMQQQPLHLPAARGSACSSYKQCLLLRIRSEEVPLLKYQTLQHNFYAAPFLRRVCRAAFQKTYSSSLSPATSPPRLPSAGNTQQDIHNPASANAEISPARVFRPLNRSQTDAQDTRSKYSPRCPIICL